MQVQAVLYQTLSAYKHTPVDWNALIAQIPGAKWTEKAAQNCTLQFEHSQVHILTEILASNVYPGVHQKGEAQAAFMTTRRTTMWSNY